MNEKCRREQREVEDDDRSIEGCDLWEFGNGRNWFLLVSLSRSMRKSARREVANTPTKTSLKDK